MEKKVEKVSHCKRLMSFALVLAMIASLFVLSTLNASAAGKYYEIKMDVPRVIQKPNTSDCALASIASVEAYFYGLSGGNHNSTAYQRVYAANGYSVSCNWGALGFVKHNYVDLEMIYAQLQKGYPVIIYRNSPHYSVIYGYNGSTTKLSTDGFLLMEIGDEYSSAKAYKSLSAWKGSYSLTQMIFRQNGSSLPVSSMVITSNHPAQQHVQGETSSVYGKVVSSSNISSVKATITTASGAVAGSSTFSATPNIKSYNLSNADSSMSFSKLAVGSYKYTVTAKNTAGETVSYEYSFSVVTSVDASKANSNTGPTATTSTFTSQAASFKGSVTSDVGLRLRSGPSTSSEQLDLIAYNTVLTFTATSGNWGKTTYNGKTGWVSLDYIKKNTNSTAGSGDVDGDGKVTSIDALLVLKSATGEITLTSAQKTAADVNGDGKVDSNDALIILQKSVS